MDSILAAAESSIVASFLQTLSNFGQGLDRLLQSCVVGENMSTCARIRKHILLPAVTPAFWVQIACRMGTEVVGLGHQTQSSRSGAAGVGDGWHSLPGPGWPGCLGRLAGPNWVAK